MTENTSVDYRKATHNDLEGMFELWWEMQESHIAYDPVWYDLRPKAECEPICADWLRKLLASENTLILLATAGDELIGLLIGHIIGRPPVFEQVKALALEIGVVTARHRRKGVFRKMLALMSSEAEARDARVVRFSVHADNPARQAFEQLGFSGLELSMLKHL